MANPSPITAGPNIVPLPLPRKLPPPPGTPPIKTQKRGATILPNFVGLRFAVHNGKTYQDVLITEDMFSDNRDEKKKQKQKQKLTVGDGSTRKRFTYKQSKNK
ncbi:hypothetical protein CNMCM8980_004445 [Aspergillus fumigatiaffinis]|uniref:Uncharacterized protein n=1 Tax=Aspergillus fumigatiaffinis TaxID=340414 RepID=A0A8H4GXI3_9EURO|nr:hypothetical protein CNMCM5878_001686 [Aspergillus fumigatiaffinis]KAF4230766.1 hypothetical protein CNMCM6457_005847 [Aspergillus fumigatiaffinis]KAF4238515.1 hypothetical protein CNMCM6805_006363 [Aspergillus fumigatiaffinis]KAF4249179.1 hypothetical protein CNMCM8980_004445 [Aspergillus fumigatiaffinis]